MEITSHGFPIAFVEWRFLTHFETYLTTSYQKNQEERLNLP